MQSSLLHKPRRQHPPHIRPQAALCCMSAHAPVQLLDATLPAWQACRGRFMRERMHPEDASRAVVPKVASLGRQQERKQPLQVSAAAMWEEHFAPAAGVPPSSNHGQQAAVERGSEGQQQLPPQGLDAGLVAEPERRCVLEVEVVNRTDLVLQVCTAGLTAVVLMTG